MKDLIDGYLNKFAKEVWVLFLPGAGACNLDCKVLRGEASGHCKERTVQSTSAD